MYHNPNAPKEHGHAHLSHAPSLSTPELLHKTLHKASTKAGQKQWYGARIGQRGLGPIRLLMECLRSVFSVPYRV